MTTTWPPSPPKNGVKYFMISFTDLFGGQRAKLVPAQAIADMQEEGRRASPGSPPGST
jgi:glutamine synthetase